MSAERRTPDQVEGERDSSSVTRTLSIQSRMSNVLAVALMCVLGLGSLTWYYTNAMMRQSRAKQGAAGASATRAQGESPLPSLGHLAALVPAPSMEPVLPPQSESMDQTSPGARTLAESPLAPNAPPTPRGEAAPKTPSQIATERELSGAVFSARSAAAMSVEAAPGVPLGTGTRGVMGASDGR
ncbi:MAG: hypothetical protein QOD56_911, partial [Gammaproteobacteria bacterium]|nr:hypothetical protein [Gammaproteobacteria bacterium]